MAHPDELILIFNCGDKEEQPVDSLAPLWKQMDATLEEVAQMDVALEPQIWAPRPWPWTIGQSGMPQPRRISKSSGQHCRILRRRCGYPWRWRWSWLQLGGGRGHSRDHVATSLINYYVSYECKTHCD